MRFVEFADKPAFTRTLEDQLPNMSVPCKVLSVFQGDMTQAIYQQNEMIQDKFSITFLYAFRVTM